MYKGGVNLYIVNIDKLIEMAPKQEVAYQELCNQILAKGRIIKTIAVIGEHGIAFKLGEFLRRAENNVLFIDADYSSSVFLNRYKLGKNLKGIYNQVSDYESSLNDLICATNRENYKIIFTGNVDKNFNFEATTDKFCNILNSYKNDFDYIILEVGDNTDVAKSCDAAILVMDNKDYSQKNAKNQVNRLTENGCLVLGVIINNF